MNPLSIIDQQRALDAIASDIAEGRTAQSYLFHGPEGVGKRASAIAFTQALLCERRADGEGMACGACLSCTKVRRGLHPDLHIYLPNPKDTPVSQLTRRLAALFENPYRQIDFRRRASLDDAGKAARGQVIYRVEYIEEIIRELRYFPVEGSRSVGVLFDADQMNDATANKFLKMLEEPPEHTVLILTAEHTSDMLPTILSRCRRIRFDLLPADGIEMALVEREDVDGRQAAFLARLANGSYSHALELLENEDLLARRELALDYLRSSITRRAENVFPHVEAINALGRTQARHVLSLMLSWVRDALLLANHGEATQVVNIDQIGSMERFLKAYPKARTDAMASQIEQAMQLVEGNANLHLTLMVLSGALADCMKGEDMRGLFEPLDSPPQILA